MNSTQGADWVALSARIGPPWTKVSRIAETGSTNAALATAARAGARSGTVLVADHQTSGRGRLERSWTAPPNTSLAISVLLRPPSEIPATRWPWLPLLAGLAVADAVNEFGAHAELKWPNDVLIDQRKLCGILAERVDTPEPAVIIGMGINTSLSAEQLPVATATSLRLAGVNVSDEDLVAGLLAAVGRWYERWLDGEDLSFSLSRRCSSVGKTVRVELAPDRAVVGEAVDVDADGRLVVRTSAGTQAFAAGDVVHLR